MLVYDKFIFFYFQTVYSSITYAGYVGILTGQRPNVFTVTVDERGINRNIKTPITGINPSEENIYFIYCWAKLPYVNPKKYKSIMSFYFN